MEFTLIFLPMMGFTFLLLDVGWMIYRRATLQYAVREGCRYAVTNQTVTINGKTYGEQDSITIQVQGRAMGFLGHNLNDLGTAKAGNATVTVNYYCSELSVSCSAVDMSTPLAVPTCVQNQNTTNPPTQPNQSGNLVEVSIVGYQALPIMPILKSAAPFTFTARSSDRMEGNPLSGAPPALTCS